MAEPNPTRRGYDRVADRYAAELAAELPGKPFDRALLTAVAELAADGPVADLGCGPAHVAAFLAAQGVRVAGLDLSARMCAVAMRDTGVPAAAADLTALPLRTASLAGLVCQYAVIHLAGPGRAAAYAEFARVLRPGGYGLISFHVRDPEIPSGGARTLTEWWGHDVDLTFRFLDPAAETDLLAAAGLPVVARLDRAPHPGAEHPSERCSLVVRRPGP